MSKKMSGSMGRGGLSGTRSAPSTGGAKQGGQVKTGEPGSFPRGVKSAHGIRSGSGKGMKGC